MQDDGGGSAAAAVKEDVSAAADVHQPCDVLGAVGVTGGAAPGALPQAASVTVTRPSATAAIRRGRPLDSADKVPF